MDSAVWRGMDGWRRASRRGFISMLCLMLWTSLMRSSSMRFGQLVGGPNDLTTANVLTVASEQLQEVDVALVGDETDSESISPAASPHDTTAPLADGLFETENEDQRDMSSPNDSFAVARRLSVPPRKHLLSSSSSNEPYSPAKKHTQWTNSRRDRSEDTAPESLTDGIEDPRQDWLVRTPSPVVAHRNRLERAATPPSSGKRQGSAGLLNRVVVSALRRRGNISRRGA